MSPDFVRYSPEIETFDPKLSDRGWAVGAGQICPAAIPSWSAPAA